MDGARSEVSSQWRKSSYSSDTANCVEFTLLAGADVGVRDSKDPTGPVLTYSPDSWQAFVDGLRTGDDR
ncbi:DUF397 domain-containing protein [Asanoa hainanensis]|uniref:DUF397 domain-containing protein n=1 Tax=Asanoa hainanensis TaxID=560556 RepID=UPI000B782581|nr:DUF397 domain-containing protein [Asanoa hainanensis]